MVVLVGGLNDDEKEERFRGLEAPSKLKKCAVKRGDDDKEWKAIFAGESLFDLDGPQQDERRSRWQRVQFVASNRDQLGAVARSEGASGLRIQHIVQRTEHIAECIGFVVRHFERRAEGQEAAEYCLDRMESLQSTNSLALFKWNGCGHGDDAKWQSQGLPVDAEVLMRLFCRYMDDALCPAIKFSERHLVEIAAEDIGKLHRLEDRVQDVAVCCVSRQKAVRKKAKEAAFGDRDGASGSRRSRNAFDSENVAKDSMPYFFVVWNRQKYGAKMDELLKARPGGGGGIKKPKAFLAESWSSGIKAVNDSFSNYLKDDDDDQFAAGRQWSKRRSGKAAKETVSGWFPEPGNNNVFHTVALFALFVQKCCDGKLAGISLRDQRCSLLDAITN